MTKKILLLCTIALLVSCRSSRILQPSSEKREGSSDLISNVQLAQPNFRSANMRKISISLQLEEKEMNVSASCKMQRDSIIYLSIQPFMGIELFKAELMPDSIRLFDKMNGRYFVCSYQLFADHFGIGLSFYNLQAMLSNQLFCLGTPKFNPALCSSSNSASGGRQIEYSSKRVQQINTVTDAYAIKQVLLSDTKGKNKFNINYDGFSSAAGVNFPNEIKLFSKYSDKVASCKLLIERVEFNTPIVFVPTDLNRFIRTDINKLFQQ